MSIESAKAFLERVKNDEDFRKSVGEIVKAEERMDFIKKAGFGFTKKEIEKVKSELTDEQVDMIAGGGGTGTYWGNNPYCDMKAIF